MNLKNPKNKIFLSAILIFFLSIMLITSFTLVFLEKIEKDKKDIEIKNEIKNEQIRIVEKKIPITLPCPHCESDKIVETMMEDTKEKREEAKEELKEEIENEIEKTEDSIEAIKENIEEDKDKERFCLTDQPYNEYVDKNGDTIREYSFIKDLKPTINNWKGNKRFFEVANLKHILPYLNFYFDEGYDHLNNITDKNIFGWSDSQANYQLLFTNAPEIHSGLLKHYFFNETLNLYSDRISEFTNDEKAIYEKEKEKHGDKLIQNNSICFLNKETDLNVNNCTYTQRPYIRLITKNLKLKLGFSEIILEIFKDYLNTYDINYLKDNLSKKQNNYGYKYNTCNESRIHNRLYFMLKEIPNEKLNDELKQHKTNLIKIIKSSYENCYENE